MKKLTLILILLLTLSVVNFADEGGTPGGNKNCPNPAIPCLVEPVEEESPVIKVLVTIIDFLI